MARHKMLAPEPYPLRQTVATLEHEFPRLMGVPADSLFQAGTDEKSHSLLCAAVWTLAKHEKVRFSEGQVARYLNLSEERVRYYLGRAETALIEAQSAQNPTRDDMLICFRCFGPALMKALSTMA